MPEQELKQPRSIHRALDVLEFLVGNGACGLQAIHRGTGLSKSTLRRILATLVERGYVRLGLTDRMYRSNVATPLGLPQDEFPRIARLVNAARPHMIALTRKVRWPAGLHFYVPGRMRIVETTHGLSHFGQASGLALDSELNIFAAASGLAWLSANPDERVLSIVASLQASELWSLQRYGLTPTQLLSELAVIRERGWAQRRTTQGTLENMVGVSVPLHEKLRPVGALTLSWRREAMTIDEFTDLHINELRQTAQSINDVFRK